MHQRTVDGCWNEGRQDIGAIDAGDAGGIEVALRNHPVSKMQFKTALALFVLTVARVTASPVADAANAALEERQTDSGCNYL
ncbi:hypothetical protein CSOJ01_14467 [Colletotrichum sojae]|uniref:Uncharacterized protein n=1 Tax=Colletotrichum sojae TaxID=2175907 RepID=A0A8H6IPS6_9PEZI|nr:hypothetical protein CSOJ01_14467 [Colletotrichum sojae]